MLGIVQNFLNQMDLTVNQKGNPLGLSASQIDEINQILTLIKAIISDGIQSGDISKMITLLGEMVELMPECNDELKSIIKALKNIEKELFGEESIWGTTPTDLLTMSETDSESDERIPPISPQQLRLLPLSMQSSPSALPTKSLSVESSDLSVLDTQRLDVAERILTLINDHMVLSQANFGALTRGLRAMNRRANAPASVDMESN